MPQVSQQDINECLDIAKSRIYTPYERLDNIISIIEKYQEKWVVKAVSTTHNTSYKPGTIVTLEKYDNLGSAKANMDRLRKNHMYEDGSERWFYYIEKLVGSQNV